MASSPDAAHIEDKGLFVRMVGVYFSPGVTFKAIHSRVSHADWLVPLILMSIVTIVSAQMTAPIIEKMTMSQMRISIEQNEEMSNAQRKKALQKVDKIQTISNVAMVVGAPAGVVVMLFLTSAVFLALVRFVLGGETTYKHVLGVNSYCSLLGIPAAIVTLPLMIAKETAFVQMGFGLLLPDSMADSYLARLLLTLNFFSVWQCALVSIGLGIVSGIPTKKAAVGVFLLFVLYALGAAALQGLAGSMWR